MRNNNGDMIPLGTRADDHAERRPVADQPLQSLSDGLDRRRAGARLLFGRRDEADGADRRPTRCRPAPASTGRRSRYQEKLVGNQSIWVFGLAMLLVYLVLAGQYESWLARSAVIARRAAVAGRPGRGADRRCGVDNNLYVQIGLILLIALSAKNAILIVEVARELRAAGRPIVEAAVEAARARFRPILMTSFAFILGVAPLVFATGAGASARKSIGVTVFSGMLASTCLAVLFVPAFFVILQRFEEWLGRRKQPVAMAPSPGQ